MILIDSNIVIYAAQPVHEQLRQFIAAQAPAVSAITVVEVLGYHKLGEEDRLLFALFFAAARMLPVSDLVVEQAVKLRQARKMSLGDSLVAATALVYGCTLATHNTLDFARIPGLKLLDPIPPGFPAP